MDRTENDLRKSFSRYTTNFRIQKENATKRLILTCFQTFVKANGKTTHKDEHHQ
jgi:hypothetical protein